MTDGDFGFPFWSIWLNDVTAGFCCFGGSRKNGSEDISDDDTDGKNVLANYKTKVVWTTLKPEWNETFEVNLVNNQDIQSSIWAEFHIR